MTMLKHFYNNIKHRARKVSAIENKQRYLAEEAHIIEGPDNLETIHNENMLKKLVVVHITQSLPMQIIKFYPY
ncbi:unnamed protein product [Leptidea sinapis]|uniref:Uncharacterized protein n=1 Tax=Leptidea sinapis TaxID=189913 RepID=A0A5E4QY44_9NEOP|nr:unnamed protein product [Leptidea sinapis]